MKTKFIWLAIFIVFSVYWNACSITKRYHNKGFYIEFGNKSKYIKKSNAPKDNLVSDTALKSSITQKYNAVNSEEKLFESTIHQGNIQSKNITSSDCFAIDSSETNKKDSVNSKRKVKKQRKAMPIDELYFFKEFMIYGFVAFCFLILGYLVIFAFTPGAGCLVYLVSAIFYGFGIGFGLFAVFTLIKGIIQA